MGWYAIFVKTGKEDSICGELSKIFEQYGAAVDLLVPKRKLMEYRSGRKNYVEKILFPGYILFETKIVEEIYYLIKKSVNHDIYTVLKTQNYFQEVKAQEMEPILNLVNSNGVIEESVVFVENDKIRIKEGPLANYTGEIVKVNKRKKRAKIKIKFLNRICQLDICIECLENIDIEETKNIIIF